MGTSGLAGTAASCRQSRAHSASTPAAMYPSRPMRLRALQQAQEGRQVLVDLVVLLQELGVRLAVQELHVRALLAHGLGEGGLLAHLLAGFLQPGQDRL